MESITQLPYAQIHHIIPASSPRNPSTIVREDRQLSLAVAEWRRPIASSSPLTLIFTHGNSFHKDLWRLIIEDLLSRTEIASQVSRVFAVDAINHGDSAVANEGLLNDRVFWPDHSQDILTVLKHFGISENVIGIGHSFGGSTLCHAAMIAPSTFKATIFIEPILWDMEGPRKAVAKASLKRKDTWNSLEEVKAAFDRISSFADWHPLQRQRHAEFGTYEVRQNNSIVVRKLKTPKEQEAATYLSIPYPQILDLISGSQGRHCFVFGENSRVLNRHHRQEILRRVQPHSRVVDIPKAQHLIPMSHPYDLSQLLSSFIADIGEQKISSKI